jgi:hypothetical protein
MYISVEAMAYSMLITSILSQIINSWPNKKLLNYSYIEQLKDMIPQMGLSVLMGIIVYCVQFINLNVIVTLVLQVIIGAVVYVSCSRFFHIDSFEYLLSTIKGLIGRKNKLNAK